jgi:hypothetical protein
LRHGSRISYGRSIRKMFGENPMGRLVRVPKQIQMTDLSIPGLAEGMLHPGIAGPGQSPNVIAADNYLERIAKYVPAEVLAFSLFINSILEQAVRAGGKSAMMAGFPVTSIALGALFVGIALTPLFVWYVREEGDAWLTNAFVSTLAFPFWAYAMNAVAFAEYRDGNLAAILLATFTVVSGLISPRMPRPKRAERKGSTGTVPKEGPRLVEAGMS